MKSTIFKKYGQNLRQAYLDKIIFVHNTKNGYIAEYVQYYPVTNNYEIKPVGVNKNGVFFTGTTVICNNDVNLYFMYATGCIEDIAKSVVYKTPDEARAILYPATA